MAQTVVVGLGRSGLGAARLLQASGHSVAVIDSGQGELLENKAEALREQGIEVRLKSPLAIDSFRPWLDDLQRVVISPGIPWNHPTIEQLRQHAVAVDGEMAVAWDALKHIPWVGITGTNGKTTVTHLLSHVLGQAGLAAPMGGNMGVSAADMALSLQQGSTPSPDWLVMELSSYQIEAADRIRPRIGIWTTLTPDHLERHGTVDAYRAIKRGLLERSDHAIFNADDPDLRQQRQSWTGGTWVSAESAQPDGHPADLWIDAEGWVRDRTQRLFPAEALAMPGAHNRQNLLLVTAAARQIGLSPASIEAGLRSFPGVPHRGAPGLHRRHAGVQRQQSHQLRRCCGGAAGHAGFGGGAGGGIHQAGGCQRLARGTEPQGLCRGAVRGWRRGTAGADHHVRLPWSAEPLQRPVRCCGPGRSVRRGAGSLQPAALTGLRQL